MFAHMRILSSLSGFGPSPPEIGAEHKGTEQPIMVISLGFYNMFANDMA